MKNLRFFRVIISQKLASDTVPAIYLLLSYCVKTYNDLEIQKSKVENRDPFLLPQISSHILRHTGCTRMAETGIDIKVLQSIMGHESISVLMQIYNHVDTKRTKKELEKLDRLTMFAL